jgi:hypothetical protein
MGENAFSTQMLRAQLDSLDHFQDDEPHHQFHVGARGEASEGLQPREHREDMYGNPVLSPKERAEGPSSHAGKSARLGSSRKVRMRTIRFGSFAWQVPRREIRAMS